MPDGIVWFIPKDEFVFYVPSEYAALIATCPYELKRISFDDGDRVWVKRGKAKLGFQLLLDAQGE